MSRISNHPDTENLGIDEQLNTAVNNWDLKKVELLLDREPAPNLQSVHLDRDYNVLRTALHSAARAGPVDIVKYLLKKGASPDSEDGEKRTPLHVAAERGHPEIVKLLVQAVQGLEEQKRYINLRDRSKSTALHLAAKCRRGPGPGSDVIEYLINAGADPSLQDNDGNSAVFCAFYRGTTTLSLFKKALKDNPTLLNEPVEGKLSRTFLHISAERGIRDYIAWLLENMDEEAARREDAQKLTAWDLACEEKTREVFFGEGRFSAVSTMALEDRRKGSMNKLFDWIELWLGQYRPDRLQLWYGFELNNRPGIFALVRDLLSDGCISEQVLEPFLRDFHNERNPNNITRVREPLCTFERLKDPRSKIKKAESGSLSEGKIAPTSECREISPEADHGTEGQLESTVPRMPEYLSIVMPYFQFLSEKQTKLWRDSQKRRDEFTKRWKYCYSNSPETFAVYMPLTLDEYCGPALPSDVLNDRNKDQVRTRFMKENQSDESRREPTEIIAVGQVWIWNLSGRLVVSPTHDPIQVYTPNPVLFDTLFPHLSPESFRGSTGNVLRYIGMMLSRLVSHLDRPFEAGRPEPILNTFEKSITLVSEKVSKYVKAIDLTKVKLEDERAYLHEIGDIREELSMIQRVLLQQEEVWRQFASNAWPENWPNGQDGRMVIPPNVWSRCSKEEGDEWRLILQAQSHFEKYRRRIEQLNEDAARVESSIIIKLDLKQKHASLQASQRSLEAANASLKVSHASAVMSAAVLGFTVVTIIFTPLSFITSLFALPIGQFQRNQVDSPWLNGTRMYTAGYIGKWAVTAEIASTAFALAAIWIAMERGMHIPLTRKTQKLLLEWFKGQKEKEANTGNSQIEPRKTHGASTIVGDEAKSMSGAGTDQSTGKSKGSERKPGWQLRRFWRRQDGVESTGDKV